MTGSLVEPARLTERDYAIMRGIALSRPIAPRGYYTLLNARLMFAEIVEEVEDQVVALDSVVRYRVGTGRSMEHKLVLGSFDALMGRTLSVRTLVGVALLGVRAPLSIDLPGEDQQVILEAVLHRDPSAEVNEVVERA